MARGLNKVMLIGNLGADPEIKYAASGTAIANIRLATAESKKDKDGNWQDHTEWHRLVAFGRTAETLKDYTRKGSKIYVEGRIQTSSWDDQNGQKKYSTEVVVHNMILLDSRSQGQGGASYGGGQQSSGQQSSGRQQSGGRPQPNNQPAPQGGGSPEQDDDLPF